MNSEHNGVGSWDALPAGTAYVAAVEVEGDQTVVRLDYPFGAHEVRVPNLPHLGNHRCTTPIKRALSVQLRNQDGVRCSVLGTSSEGPKRIDISVPQALALAESGVHTVFQNG